MTFEQIERAVNGMVRRLVEEFEHGEIGIVGVMERLCLIEQWEESRMAMSEDNFKLVMANPCDGRTGR